MLFEVVDKENKKCLYQAEGDPDKTDENKKELEVKFL